MRSTLPLMLFILLLLPGCGSKPAAPAVSDSAPETPCATCTGSDTTGAICDDAVPLDTTKAGNAAQPKPAPAAARALPRLWEFGRGTCIPCKTMKGILDPMTTEFAGRVEIRMLNIDDEPALTKQFRIQMIPTQVFIDAAGQELFRHVGVFPRDSIVAKFKEFSFAE